MITMMTAAGVLTVSATAVRITAATVAPTWGIRSSRPVITASTIGNGSPSRVAEMNATRPATTDTARLPISEEETALTESSTTGRQRASVSGLAKPSSQSVMVGRSISRNSARNVSVTSDSTDPNTPPAAPSSVEAASGMLPARSFSASCTFWSMPDEPASLLNQSCCCISSHMSGRACTKSTISRHTGPTAARMSTNTAAKRPAKTVRAARPRFQPRATRAATTGSSPSASTAARKIDSSVPSERMAITTSTPTPSRTSSVRAPITISTRWGGMARRIARRRAGAPHPGGMRRGRTAWSTMVLPPPREGGSLQRQLVHRPSSEPGGVSVASIRAEGGGPAAVDRRLAHALVLVAGLLCALAVGYAAHSAPADETVARGLFELLVVGVPVAAGLYALRSPRDARFGAILIGVGLAWTLTALGESPDSLPYTIGRVSAWLVFPWLIYLMLAFPQGRVAAGLDRMLLLALNLLLALLFVGSALFVEAYPPLTPWASCRLHCPANAFLLVSHEPAAMSDVVQPTREALAVLLFAAVTVSMARRWHAASALRRSAVAPVMLASGVSVVLLAAFFAQRRYGSDADTTETLGRLWGLCIPAIAAAFYAGIVRRRLQL